MIKDILDRHLPPPHPGEVLKDDILPALAISQAALARHLAVPTRRITDLVAARRPITLDLAQRLGAALGTGARYWLGLQMQHDLWLASASEPVRVRPVTWPSRRPMRDGEDEPRAAA